MPPFLEIGVISPEQMTEFWQMISFTVGAFSAMGFITGFKAMIT